MGGNPLGLGQWCFVTIVLVLGNTVKEVKSQLKNGYYSSSCPKAESIVRSTVQAHFKYDPSIAPGLLRLHFHDCFVQGCDGSVLIKGPTTERTALPNLGLRGFDVIDDAKSQLEAECPGVVSCADILALAARDAVDLSDGPSWNVPTGRKDGRVSLATQASNLPSPLDSVAVQKQKFDAKGLDSHDLVTLVGAHTIGQTDCLFFRYRLYNFTVTGNSDPTITPSFVSNLKTLCPPNDDGSKRVDLDIDSPANFDVNFFKNIRDGKGVLESDQRLWSDSDTNDVVKKYASSLRGLFGIRFDYEFGKAMVKMSSIEVKTGADGEIRRVCSKVN
ncbi:PREDICTED: peroxidase 25 [Tarenaya hassleriana]|uniref:peroxidase 25 n=1 Tax=Tarenaya hassleriana TaxID=28532 RepID=UPI00053C57C0|nr:PREDICTED: peroxidase 25 [Tarenaya hassleriana]